MNKLEQLVYNSVKGNRLVKNTIRNIYQIVFDVLPRRKNFSINEIEVKEGHFFGFHDISPFSVDDKYVLANKLTIPFKMPKKGDMLEVGYFPFDNRTGDFIRIGSTLAWNYHKGCRLQWLGEDKVIYNDVLDNRLISRIVSLKGTGRDVIQHPIGTASPCGRYATSFSYHRLERLMPGYGYLYKDNSYLEEKISDRTGFFIIDITTGKKELVVSLKDLSAIGNLNSEEDGCHHFVTHTLFSHDSRYASFLHEWTNINHIHKRWSRLVVYDRMLKKVFVSPTSGMVSHYVWNKRNQILAYCRIENIDSHVLFKEPTMQEYERVGLPQLNSDGHQSFITDTTFVTDTYPDKFRMANVYKVNIESKETTFLARLSSPKKYQSQKGKHWACDLHPRINSRGTILCFDSVHTGKRSLCFMHL